MKLRTERNLEILCWLIALTGISATTWLILETFNAIFR